ncbi:hypothetical protein Tco_0492518 [Tanacetum coccineum]
MGVFSSTKVVGAKIEKYTEEIRHGYEQRLETIWSRLVNRVHVFVRSTMEEDCMGDHEHLGSRVYPGVSQSLAGMSDTEMWGHAPEKACGGEEERDRLSGGHFIGRLAMHFRLVSDEGLRGLQVPKQAAAADAFEADEAGQAAKEVAQEIPAPA